MSAYKASGRFGFTSPTRLCVTLLLCCAAPGGSVFGQAQFVAIPPQQAAQYHFNFVRYYFASPEAEKADRATLYATLKELESFKGRVGASADNLQRMLELYDAAQVKFARHYIYLYLRSAVNTQDEASRSGSSTLDAEMNARTAFIQQELMRLDEHRLAVFVSRKPALKKYLFAVETARRDSSHTLSLKEEELLNATAPLNREWQYELYQKLIARTPPANAQTKPGVPERVVREERFKQRYAALASQRDLYAFTLTRLALAGNDLARRRHFEGAAEASYFARYWSKAEVNNLLEQVAAQADLYKRYQQLRADYVRGLTGEKDAQLWDMSVRPPRFEPPRFTIEEASRTIRDALVPLGSAYGRELAALLDPMNGRMDIVPGANRKSGGFSQGFVGTDSMFYAAGFAGSYNDMRVLAHESTHAVQRQLMSRGGVLPVYSSSPSYFAESFAIFNEFLLPDYLYRHETDPLRKRYYLEQFLEGKGTVMFVAAPEALLEQAVYDGVARGTVTGADDLDALTKAIYSRFSIWTDKHDELKNQWMLVPLMYEDPFYDINYVYGALLALKYYELYARDPSRFVPRYIALMSHGFDAPPAVLLKRFLDIDLNDPHLVADACRIVKEKVDLLEESYRR
jgi:oligoendopeptidase F